MTARRSLTRRIAAAGTALFAIAAVATTGAVPVPYTEAGWTDDVYVNASFEADPNAGINSAGAAGSNGTMERILTTSNIRGVVSAADNVDRPEHADSGNKDFPASGILDLVSLQSNARSCARVNEIRCPAEPANTPSVLAFAQSDFNSMEIATAENLGAWLIRYRGGTANPIRTTASCTPGIDGVVGIEPGAEIQIRRGLTGLLPRSVTVPTESGDSDEETGYITNAWRYRTEVSYFAETGPNYARSEVKLTVKAEPLLGNDPTWTVDLLLSRAECGVSRPLAGVTPASANPDMVLELSEEDELAVEDEADEAEMLEDEPTDPLSTESTTSASPSSQSTITSPSSTTRPSPSSTRETTSTASTRTTSTRVPTVTTRSTTSAPPTTTPPATQTTTTTSTAPVIVVPAEPGNLSATAETEEAGTVEADGEELVVVVRGDTVPGDARTAPAALDTWINDSRQPSGNWTTFTSDDPDEDGWRWAAINQETGTIVYIR